MRKSVLAGVLGAALLTAFNCQAADWIKNNFDIPNKNVEGNYYDGQSVKAKDRTLSWTEKFELTPFGAEHYTKHLETFPACKAGIKAKGPVTMHQMDFEIKDGKFRIVAKRNYTKKGDIVCTDKDMNHELSTDWHDIKQRGPMYERYYMLVTKYKLGNI